MLKEKSLVEKTNIYTKCTKKHQKQYFGHKDVVFIASRGFKNTSFNLQKGRLVIERKCMENSS